MDPFDAITPIGQRATQAPEPERHHRRFPRAEMPPHLAPISQPEREARARVHRAHRVGVDPTASSGPDQCGKPLKKIRLRSSVVSVAEALAMTSDLTRIFYRDALASTRGSERKHLAVGYGVMIDKLNALSGRPTSILGVTDIEGQRAGALELSQRIAAAARERTA